MGLVYTQLLLQWGGGVIILLSGYDDALFRDFENNNTTPQKQLYQMIKASISVSNK